MFWGQQRLGPGRYGAFWHFFPGLGRLPGPTDLDDHREG